MNYRGVSDIFHAYYVKPLHKRSVLGHEHQILSQGTGVSASPRVDSLVSLPFVPGI